MSKAVEKVKEEFWALLPPTVFFFFALNLAATIHSLMLRGTGVPVATFLTVSVGALVMGKAVLIADLLPFINRYPNEPLIYNIAWKSTLYTLMSMTVHYVEQLIEAWRKTGSIVAGNKELIDEMVWAHFAAIQLLMMTMIISYCTLRELERALGRKRMIDLFFRKGPGAAG